MDENRSLATEFRDAIRAVNNDGERGVDEFIALCDPYIVFQDPLVTIYGKEELRATYRKLVTGHRDFYMSLSSVVEQDNQLFATWTLSFTPRVGPRITIEGSTHAQLRDGLITYHRDYWDLLGSMLGTIPALGLLYRRATSLLA